MSDPQLLDILLRPASESDRSFVEAVFFETQQWLIETLFGHRGNAYERAKFASFYDKANTNIIIVNGQPAGWLTVVRTPDAINLQHIYITARWQNKGIGSTLLRPLIDEAQMKRMPLTLSTAKINPARTLYERLGFVIVGEDQYKVEMEMR